MCWNVWNNKFPIFPIFIFELCSFLYPNFRWIFPITRKIKTQKIGKLIFHTFQHIPHLSCKYEHFWNFFLEKHLIHLAKKIIWRYSVVCYFLCWIQWYFLLFFRNIIKDLNSNKICGTNKANIIFFPHFWTIIDDLYMNK